MTFLKDKLNLNHSVSLFQIIIYGYILLPVLLFFSCWMRLPWSILFSVILLISWFLAVSDGEGELQSAKGNKEILRWGIVLLVIIVWVLLSGIGGYCFQNDDQLYRNEIFEILCNNKWPVKISLEVDGTEQVRGLFYYIGFWLPAAAVGKVLGVSAGYFVQFLWAVLGVVIVYKMICDWLQTSSVFPLFGLIFFSGLDYIGCLLIRPDIASFYPLLHLEWWADKFQFSSNTTQLFWVFNQALYGWILTLLILRQKNNRRMALIWGCGLLECTMPFAGMIPFLIYQMIRLRSGWKNLLTFENILGGGCIGILSFIYIIGNISATESKTVIVYDIDYFIKYAWFILLEVGLYFILTYQKERKNALYWITLAVLLICPWIHVGHSYDFCMRASIPALLILMLMVLRAWAEYIRQKQWLIVSLFTLIFLLGSITPCCEIYRTILYTIESYSTEGKTEIRKVELSAIMGAPNFSGNIENNFFYHYLAEEQEDNQEDGS